MLIFLLHQTLKSTAKQENTVKTKWNTGAHYGAHGQRIAAQTVDKGIVFEDIDRHIGGFIPLANAPRDIHALRDLTMANYLYGNYSSAQLDYYDIAAALRKLFD